MPTLAKTKRFRKLAVYRCTSLRQRNRKRVKELSGRCFCSKRRFFLCHYLLFRSCSVLCLHFKVPLWFLSWTITFKVCECFASLISFHHHLRPHLLRYGFLRFPFVAGLLGPIAIIAPILNLFQCFACLALLVTPTSRLSASAGSLMVGVVA